MFETRMAADMARGMSNLQDGHIPFPHDIGAAAIFILSDTARWTAVAILPCDGGKKRCDLVLANGLSLVSQGAAPANAIFWVPECKARPEGRASSRWLAVRNCCGSTFITCAGLRYIFKDIVDWIEGWYNR